MRIFTNIEIGLLIISDSCLTVLILGHAWDLVEGIAVEFGSLETAVSSKGPMSLGCGVVYRGA